MTDAWDEVGEEFVRERIGTGYWPRPTEERARAWLERKDHERALGREEAMLRSNEEQMRIARSAKNAAWAAAIAAIIAAIIAIVSLVIVFTNGGGG